VDARGGKRRVLNGRADRAAAHTFRPCREFGKVLIYGSKNTHVSHTSDLSNA
jgi:hypothetical protein